ncbi:MAG: 4-hydroxythreonine-4-phosphate dehydrogenase PdxA [Wenzhouxiangellaceae bacterium]
MIQQPLLLTPGEPSGVGPELAVEIAASNPGLVVVADPELLARSLPKLQAKPLIATWQPGEPIADRAGVIHCLPIRLAVDALPGKLDRRNAAYVLECLSRSVQVILSGRAAGLVTGPVHKAIINDAGIAFSGHTEFLADLAGIERVVMMLVADRLRVALATTHLPLSKVPAAISRTGLEQTLRIIAADLAGRFDIEQPRIAVLGLNPHAGEGGHLGREEIDVIEPVVAGLRAEGLRLEGPLPADTAFVLRNLKRFDAVLAMSHDQGLPVLKYAGFGHAVNVTLGLPFIRTSVDHGTALDLAGTGKADPGSLKAAIELAQRMTRAGTAAHAKTES